MLIKDSVFFAYSIKVYVGHYWNDTDMIPDSYMPQASCNCSNYQALRKQSLCSAYVIDSVLVPM